MRSGSIVVVSAVCVGSMTVGLFGNYNLLGD